jgi:hypothetical protein
MIINQTSDILWGDAKGKQMGTPFRFYPRAFIEVPRKFRYGSQGLELADKVNGASRATVKSNRVTLTIEPAPQP